MQFSMLSSSEIVKMAEVQVWKPQYYDHTRKPVEGGLLDGHMVRHELYLAFLLTHYG